MSYLYIIVHISQVHVVGLVRLGSSKTWTLLPPTSVAVRNNNNNNNNNNSNNNNNNNNNNSNNKLLPPTGVAVRNNSKEEKTTKRFKDKLLPPTGVLVRNNNNNNNNNSNNKLLPSTGVAVRNNKEEKTTKRFKNTLLPPNSVLVRNNKQEETNDRLKDTTPSPIGELVRNNKQDDTTNRFKDTFPSLIGELGMTSMEEEITVVKKKTTVSPTTVHNDDNVFVGESVPDSQQEATAVGSDVELKEEMNQTTNKFDNVSEGSSQVKGGSGIYNGNIVEFELLKVLNKSKKNETNQHIKHSEDNIIERGGEDEHYAEKEPDKEIQYDEQLMEAKESVNDTKLLSTKKELTISQTLLKNESRPKTDRSIESVFVSAEKIENVTLGVFQIANSTPAVPSAIVSIPDVDKYLLKRTTNGTSTRRKIVDGGEKGENVKNIGQKVLEKVVVGQKNEKANIKNGEDETNVKSQHLVNFQSAQMNSANADRSSKNTDLKSVDKTVIRNQENLAKKENNSTDMMLSTSTSNIRTVEGTVKSESIEFLPKEEYQSILKVYENETGNFSLLEGETSHDKERQVLEEKGEDKDETSNEVQVGSKEGDHEEVEEVQGNKDTGEREDEDEDDYYEDEEGEGDVGGKLRLDVSHSEIVRWRRVFKDGNNSKDSGYSQLGTLSNRANMFFRADPQKSAALEGMIGSKRGKRGVQLTPEIVIAEVESLLKNFNVAAVRTKYPLRGENSSSDKVDMEAEDASALADITRRTDTNLEPKHGKEAVTRTLSHINSRRKSLQPYNPSYLQKTLKPFKETELDKRLQDQSQPSPKDITMPYKKMSLLYSSFESGAEPQHQILASLFIVAFSLNYLFNASNLPARL